MAIYIQIVKREEDDGAVLYDFGPIERIVGAVLLTKSTGEVSVLELDEPQREQFYLPRVVRVLKRHFERGEYPGSTSYRA